MRTRHFILGVISWLAVLGAGGWMLQQQLQEQSSSVAVLSQEVRQWVGNQQSQVNAGSAVPLYIALDDPVFMAVGDDRYVQAGFVSSVDGTRSREPQAVRDVQVTVYRSATDQFPEGYRLEYFTTPMSLDWVVRMLIPPERQQEIAELVRKEWEQHEREVMAELQPVVQEGIRRALASIERELPEIIARHRPEFQALGDRFEADILKEQLLPLAQEEIFPVIREEVRPLATDIARTLWKRVSVASFTWRYLYDVSPLPSRNAVQTEFRRFLREEAMPELQSRSDEFVEVTRNIMDRVMENEKVRSTVRQNMEHVIEDPQLRDIVWSIIQDATLNNTTLREDMRDYLASRDTRRAVQLASSRLEPTLRSIGDLVFGTREKGITPEFSRILRSQVLKKDRRWFVMVPLKSQDGAAEDSARDTSDTISVALAQEPMLYPLKFAGTQQSPLTPEAPAPIRPR